MIRLWLNLTLAPMILSLFDEMYFAAIHMITRSKKIITAIGDTNQLESVAELAYTKDEHTNHCIDAIFSITYLLQLTSD